MPGWSKQQWKAHEKRVAEKLGGTRAFNTGSHNSSDVIHPKFVVECKYRKKFAARKFYEQAKMHAQREFKKTKTKKVPLVVVKEHNQNGELVMLSLDDFIQLVGLHDSQK